MKQRVRYKKVNKGVYLYVKKATKLGKVNPKNVYRVLKTVKGVKNEAYFMNKTKAIKFYKSL